MPTGKESKNYLRSYINKAESLGIKVKAFNFNICGPVVTQEAIEFANYMNIAIKELNGVKIQINVFTLEQLIKELMTNINGNKWFITSQVPSICWGKDQVQYLISEKKAILTES